MKYIKNKHLYRLLFTFLFFAVLSLGSQNQRNENGIDDFTLWMVKEKQPILATVSYQSAELNFFSPSEQGFIGKINAVYYSEPELKNEYLTRKETRIYFPFGQGSFSNDYKEDSFGAVWTGVIRPSFTETYKIFTRTDDGVRLWINGKLLIDKWQDMGTTEFSTEMPFIAGKDYAIKMEYYDRGGDAYAELSWQSNSTTRSIIREIGSFEQGYSFENPYGLESEWNATYFKGREFKELILSKKESTLAFTSNKDAFAPGVPTENFCARFTSLIKIPKSGKYTFFTTSDDGIRLKINGKPIIDQWTWMGATEFSEHMEFREGDEVFIEVEYFQGGGGKYLKVEWQPPNKEREIISLKGKRNRSNPNQTLDIYPGKIYSKDLNQDGRNDLVILHPTYNGKVSILMQERDNILNFPYILKAGKDPKEILFADLNHDGRDELILVGKTSPSFLIYWNLKNEWKQEVSPKWNDTIKEIKILPVASKSKSNPILYIIGKSGGMAKINFMPGNSWSNFTSLSDSEKNEISLSNTSSILENKCQAILSKSKVCYDKLTNEFTIKE